VGEKRSRRNSGRSLGKHSRSDAHSSLSCQLAAFKAVYVAKIKRIRYEVETAIDGVDAFEHLDHQWNAYDVILLDLTMPRLNGLQFLQKTQERDSTLLRSIIALSADEEALRQSAGMGIGNTLSKSFDLDVLLALVGGVIGGSEKQASVCSC
jgi:DNA-binding response OmpR family regulator